MPQAQRPEGPAWVVGSLVYTALRHWRFPDREGFEDFLRPYALEAGLTDLDKRPRALLVFLNVGGQVGIVTFDTIP
nr:hypothetical protein [Anaerolineae bacterium]